MKILLAGANGNLGKFLSKYLASQGIEVVECVRNREIKETFQGALDRVGRESQIPDCIVNATGKYLPDSFLNSKALIQDAVIKTTESLIHSNREWQLPVINFSTYFQFNSDAIPNYKNYISAKTTSSSLWNAGAQKYNFSVIDLALYDNYGGERRTKYLESLIDATKLQQEFLVSNPNNHINLVSLLDISKIILKILQSEFFDYNQFQIRNSKDYTLGEIADLVTVNSGLGSVVKFNRQQSRLINGGELWNCAPDLDPAWVYSRIEDYINQQFTA
jgi:nucleoside-diphosphate-sugar epimerase